MVVRDSNCLTVTISVNAMLRKGKSRIEISGLLGASFPFGQKSGDSILNITSASEASPRDHTFFCASASDSACEPGTATFVNGADPRLE